MKKILPALVILLITNTAFASMFYDCLSDQKMRKDEQYRVAKNKLSGDLSECYRFPMGEKYEACRYKSQVNFEKQQDRISKDFRVRQRACFRENL